MCDIPSHAGLILFSDHFLECGRNFATICKWRKTFKIRSYFLDISEVGFRLNLFCCEYQNVDVFVNKENTCLAIKFTLFSSVKPNPDKAGTWRQRTRRKRKKLLPL